MRLLSALLSKALFAAMMGIVVLALGSNFVVIAQAMFHPLKVVQGNSMSPGINDDDAVFITDVTAKELSLGDIVVFGDPENHRQKIMHRIVDFQTHDGSIYAITRGDANSINDPYLVPLEGITGRVWVTLPKAGLFLSHIRTMPGFISCVICPLALLLLYLLGRCYLEKTGTNHGFLSKELIPSS
ncbi:MAG: signal peptidase I [Actinomycetota bacterium]|nr:signal peptidase I [Actinomycetota bacterium]